MTSRLERLYVLLENGSSASTRRAAAEQLGNVQKLHPHELYTLLDRLRAYLYSDWWECRVAAGLAVEAILKNVPQWNPPRVPDTASDGSGRSGKLPDRVQLSLSTFSVDTVLSVGPLLTSGHEVTSDHVTQDTEQQKLLIHKQLGLDPAAQLTDSSEIVSTEDLAPTSSPERPLSPSQTSNGERKFDISSEASSAFSESDSSLRAHNKLRRKRLQPSQNDGDSEKASKKIKAESKPVSNSRPLSSYLSCENWQESVEWPLEGFCEMLLEDLCSSSWQVRHGAAIALRYTLITHGAGAGRALGLTKHQMEEQHYRRLEDIALRVMRVLVLDRFGDYVGDQVVAPVRESTAQALVAVFHLLYPGDITSTTSSSISCAVARTSVPCAGSTPSSTSFAGITPSCVVAESSSPTSDTNGSAVPVPASFSSGGRALTEHLTALLVSLSSSGGGQWQIRHAAQLTLKYLLPVRLEQRQRHLAAGWGTSVDHNVNVQLVNMVLTGLDDSQDDVVAVAAATLCHCASSLFDHHQQQQQQLLSSLRLQQLSCRLWRELLPALDDLMTCTPAVVQLLSALVTRNVDIPQCSVSGLVEYLWPFMCHVSSSVRLSATQAMLALVKFRSVDQWRVDVVQSTLRLTMQCTLTENRQPTVETLGQLWRCLLSSCPLASLLTCVCPLVASWLCMLMQPARVPYTPSLLFHPPPHQHQHQERKQDTPSQHFPPPPPSTTATTGVSEPSATESCQQQTAVFLGGPAVSAAAAGEGDGLVVGARLSGCRLMGWLSPYIVQPMPGATYTEQTSPIATYMSLLASHLSSRSYLQRFVVGHVVAVWMQADNDTRQNSSDAVSANNGASVSSCHGNRAAAASSLVDQLISCCTEQLCYDETAVMFARLQRDCRDYIAQLKHYKLTSAALEQLESVRVLSFEQVDRLVGPVSDLLIDPHLGRLQVKVQRCLQERRLAVRATCKQVSADQARCSNRTQVALVCAVVASRLLPDKLTGLVRPLIDCIKRETNQELQMEASRCLLTLIQLVSSRHTNPVDKIVRNLCSFVCCDPNFTPQIPTGRRAESSSNRNISGNGIDAVCTQSDDSQRCSIITWDQMQQAATDQAASRNSSGSSTECSSVVTSDLATIASVTSSSAAPKSPENDIMFIQRRGATAALTLICQPPPSSPPCQPAPALTSMTSGVTSLSVDLVQRSLSVLDAPRDDCDAPVMNVEQMEAVQQLVNALQLLELLVPHVSDVLLTQIMSYLPHLRECLQHEFSGVRHMASRCISALTRLRIHPTLAFVCQHILPMLEDPVSVTCRRGASETIASVLQCSTTSLSALSYLPLLTLPVLARMSDQDSSVRGLCAQLFGQLVQLMPLQQQQKGEEEGGMPQQLRLASDRQRVFIERLMSPDTIVDQPLTVRLRDAELRSYQRRGVSWLQFLAQYRLHGILCDDMGLGKSLQTLCVLAATAAAPPDSQALSNCSLPLSETAHGSAVVSSSHLPSLIVCPPTLTGHWMYEVERFMEPGVLVPLHYCGLPTDRRLLQRQISSVNLVISSYDIVRNDLSFFSAVNWNYCVLDEGHMIRNGRTKLARAIKQLQARHRLILTGTPLQNSVLELWSLFDFLMPGFLGTEKQFNSRYSRPILLSREARANSREEEAGALALEALHRQVLPFMLRRLKEDVLDDLPPKITQDYRCRLSEVQRLLYEDFARSRAQTTLVAGIEQQQQQHGGGADKKTHSHVFQALQYLRKVCNHPKLVLTPEHPSYAAIMTRVGHNSGTLSSIEHSGKLTALRQLLTDLGMGEVSLGQPADLGTAAVPSINRHRALVFCQLKSMLDIVERDLLQRHLPSVSYLRLDGSVPAGERQQLVNRFNTDVTYDLLLLTTQVGGLGLNLTGADTVIFVEHDWNPMKDLQAMDRVHRIGQKRVVNVYRLIAESTIEEKIMGLQKFKLMTANSVVTSDNSSLLSMGTAQLFDLFTLDDRSARGQQSRDSDSNHAQGVRAMLQALPELWDDREYEREYDLSSFLHTLRS